MMDIWYPLVLAILIFWLGVFLGYKHNQDSEERRKVGQQPAQSEPVALSPDIERVIVAAESRLRTHRGDDGQEAQV